MTLEDLTRFPVLQTASIAETIHNDPDTLIYVTKCLFRCYEGNYGIVPPEDTEANNRDLESGYGHILARYKKAQKLEGDIYINIHFDADHLDDVDYTNNLIMYCNEY